MSKINYQELREAAEQATQDEWVAYILPGHNGIYPARTSEGRHCGYFIDWPGIDGQRNAGANARYIAAIPPKVALALLGEIKRLEDTNIDAMCRIAELESNEVREVGNQFLVVRHPGKTPVIKHCTGDLEEFLRKLIEQDPLVTIDIITHRHYGIGGQWVQDAVEYLHMMSDAGIRIKGE
ncbi:TPA: ead/Ea22-like family protein [Escherichia coli]|nr:ead/Ea22-like family protein [Escherichia coli]